MRKLLFSVVVIGLLVGIAVQTGLARPVVKWGVEQSLLDSGMSEDRADCMSGRMVDRLSLGQLWKLRSAMQPREGEREKPDGFRDTIQRLRRADDTEIVTVVGTSAGICALGL